MRRLTAGGVDTALECVGVPETCDWAVRSLRRGGVAALAGIGPQPLTLAPTSVLAALEVRGVFGYAPDDVARVIRLIEAGALDARAAVSAVLPLHEAGEAVDRFRRKEGSPVRVLLSPPTR